MRIYLKATIDLMLSSTPEIQAEAELLIRSNKAKQLENGLIYLVVEDDE